MKLKRRVPEPVGADADSDADAAGAMSSVNCVVGGAQLAALDAAARTAHVNACIDGRAVGEESCCTCAVCGRDLSGYTDSARIHHANRCCDRLSEASVESSPSSSAVAAQLSVAASWTASTSERSPAAPMTRASSPSLCNCVVCGKDITKLKNQTEHMKRCAKRTGMPAARLLELARGVNAGDSEMPVSNIVRQPGGLGPRKKLKDQRQQLLGSGKENVVDGTATAAAHMPIDSAIVTWLRQAGLAKYCPIFLREEIDLDGALQPCSWLGIVADDRVCRVCPGQLCGCLMMQIFSGLVLAA